MNYFSSLRQKILAREDLDLELIQKAYEFAAKAHHYQKRYSGEKYIIHPVAVAEMLCSHNADQESIIAALLHDIVEDTNVTSEEIKENFGKNVQKLVDGLTKISKILYAGTKEDRVIDNFYRLIFSSAQDLRIISIKLIDRLHNLKTSKHLRLEKRQKVAIETLEIHVPLACFIGSWKIMVELEELAFSITNKTAYSKIDKYIQDCQKKYLKMLLNDIEKLKAEFRKENISAEINILPRRKYSLFQKSDNLSINFDKLPFPLMIKILPSKKLDCYRGLGILHNMFSPRFDRMKDYIASTKENGYSALHTGIFYKHGINIDVHFLTFEMNRQNDFGFIFLQSQDRSFTSVINDIIKIQKNSTNKSNFYEQVKQDILNQHINIFLPNGETHNVPKNITIIDLAYIIYEKKANYLSKVFVNDQNKNLFYSLEDGDVVEFYFAKEIKTDLRWLHWTKTTKAKKLIKENLLMDNEKNTIAAGQREIDFYLYRFTSLDINSIDDKIKAKLKNFNCKDINELYLLIGKGEIEIKKFLKTVLPEKSLLFSVFSLKFSSLGDSKEHRVKIHIEANDKINMLNRFVKTISGEQINIIESSSYTDPLNGFVCEFGISVKNFDQLFHLCELLNAIDEVKLITKI